MKILHFLLIFISSIILISSACGQEATDDNLHHLIPEWLAEKSPVKQYSAGISANSVVCHVNLQLVIENNYNYPACVRPETANALLERGWAKSNTSAIHGVLGQDYYSTEYRNGTKIDFYDINVKADITSMPAMLRLQILFPNGTTYMNDIIPISNDQYDGYKYHVNIKHDKNTSQNGFKAIISYGNDSAIVNMPPTNESQDIFGIREIYPTKKNGAQWFMNADDIANDTLFSSIPYVNSSCSSPSMCTAFYKNFDGGSWHVKRIVAPENEGIRLVVNAPPNTLWLNTEMTGYYRLGNNTYYPQEFTHVVRSGSPHTSICQGYSYYLSITYDGNVAEIQKSLYHAGDASSYSETFTASGITTPLSDRWFGFKTMTYNINDTAVKFEIWIDDKDDNNWRKVFEKIDAGWPVPGNPADHGCKNIRTGQPMSNNDVISWGGTEQQFRADDAEMDFKNLSIREIDPPVH